jgi:sigma-54 interacting transcriptional regulator
VRGTQCNCLPIPGASAPPAITDPPEPIRVSSPEVVITSPVVQQALADLSDIWQDKATAVLVSAPPGSGKENFALSIPYGSGRRGDSIPTVSLADGTLAQQEKLILGYQQDDGSIVDGMLAKAKGFAVFIDEAHYPLKKPGMRAKLLRALEAKEYFPAASMQLRKVEDVQWLFASSLPLDAAKDSLGQSKPNDFWTRMSHMIRIEHPLRISGDQEIVLRNLFTFFWWDRIKSHFAIDPAKVLSTAKEPDDLRDDNISDQLSRGYVRIMLEEDSLNRLAGAFFVEMMNTIGGESLPEVSIRGLRSMVSRVFSRCVSAVTSGSKNEWGAVFAEPSSAVDEKVNKYICKVIRETQQIARLRS